ncbi:HDOD domain-containing protein [Ectothiorhodospiraceae bacterium WFHF3C12]|nr:HDOD domain-containing protein [Ectothiorhodospiraceae bacterium WFHF3C12]
MSTNVTPELLEGLVPLRELTGEALSELARCAELEDLPAKTALFKKGSTDEWTRYVLSGEVVLVDGPGSQASTVVGMGDGAVATQPLGLEQPHATHALARTDVRLIRIPRQRIEQALEESRLPDYDVAEVEAESSSEQMFYGLIQDLMEDRLELPSMPDIAVRVREAVSDPDCGAPEVAKIVQADPSVAARLMQAANSALFAGQSAADNLTAAIVRLGLRNVRELVMAVTMREVFKAKNPLLNKRMVEVWMHSTLIAAISSVLAKKLKGFDSERGLLAGLVHDIGVVPMVANAAEYPDMVSDPAKLEATINAYRGQVGSMILRRWNFPDDMVDAATEAENWERDHDGQADYADLVIAAQLQSMAGTSDAAKVPSLEQIPAYNRLGLAEIGITESEPVLEEAREEIAEVQRFLMGK